MYMYAAGLLSELGTVRMHKALYQDSIDVPSSPLSLLVPSQTQHFESTSSIKQPRPCLSPAAKPRRATYGAYGREIRYLTTFSLDSHEAV